MRVLVCCAALLALSDLTRAQRPVFEVTSVKLNKTATSVGFRVSTPSTSNVCCARLVATNATVRAMLRYSYPDLLPYQFVGGPAWIDTARFDVEGRPATLVPNEQIRLMTRALLEDRFGLKSHVEKRELPTYHLVVTKAQPRIRAVTTVPDRDRTGLRSDPSGMIMTGTAAPIPVLIRMLQTWVDRRIVDRTSLSGRYDFELRFSQPSLAPPADAAFPVLFTALPEQLDLKLEAAREPIEVVVVDAARMPDEN